MSTRGINAGRMARRVFDIEELCDGKGAMGGAKKEWSKYRTAVHGQLIHVAARELMAAGQHQSEIKARLFLRWYSGVTAKMRINDGGTIYAIVSQPIDRTGSRRQMELHLSSGVSDA